MRFTKPEFWWSAYMGAVFSFFGWLITGGSIVLSGAYFIVMFVWTLLSHFIVKVLGKLL